ncbi:MAG: gliding motility-associated C-terminal domain-containing protein [Bacteroidota bacterium]
MGGEITWQCLPSGQYKFTMKLYRECNGVTFGAVETMNIVNYPNIGNSTPVSMSLISQTDISPDCNSAYPNITCTPAPAMPNTGAVEEWVYESAAITLSGVPGAAGWIFTYSSCCRNPCTNIIGASNIGWTLRAVMYSFNGANANPCFDNSPTFTEKPSTVICAGYPFTYNHNAVDKDLDSLAFKWAQPLDDSNVPIAAFSAGYTYNSPLPGPIQNSSNVAALVDVYTGEISFTSYTQGAFVTVCKVESWKCGVKVAEIFREMQVVLLNCPGNTPPLAQAPFINPANGFYEWYSDTVYAGELVTFPFAATDFQQLPNGVFQTLSIYASGQQFGTGYTSTTTGCLNPPCATLTPPPPASAQFGVNTNFSWQTTCDHLATTIGCGVTSNVYNFILKAQDDFCPAPAYSIQTITIVVKSLPILPPPDLRCLAVQPNGSVTLTWIPPVDTFPSFNSYHIFYSTNPAGPFTEIDSIFNYNITSYTHTTTNANLGPRYYYLQTRSGCNGIFYSAPSDTMKTMYLQVSNVGNTSAFLTWNPIHTPPHPHTFPYYRIYRDDPMLGWQIFDSTLNTTYSTTNVLRCDTNRFRIEVGDSLGCISVSNIDYTLFTDSVKAPELHCIAVNAAGQVTITWEPSIDVLGIFDCYQIYSSSNAAGPFTLVDSIFNINTTTYTHATVNANTAPVYYYIVTRSECTGHRYSSPGDTLKSIFLSAANTGLGFAALSWNPIRIPALSSTYPWYRIYREYPAGTWTLIDSTQIFFYPDTIFFCSQLLNYRIEIGDSLGCISVSNIDGDIFQDITPPVSPVIDTVSVDATTQNAVISWSPSTSPDAIGYIVYQMINGVWTSLDTVYGINNTTFTNLISNAGDMAEYYTIAALDGCMNTSPMSDLHRTIYLTTSLDICDANNTIRWNSYVNMKPGVKEYRLFVSENAGPVQLLTTTTSTDTSYVHNNLNVGSTLCYFVQAIDTSGLHTSTSNTECVIVTFPKVPQFCYINHVTVVDNDYVELSCFVDTSAYVKKYRIMRANDPLGAFYEVATISNVTNPILIYMDFETSPKMQSYTYKVIVVDSCNNEAITSNLAQTILLTGESKNDMTNYLTWNDYQTWLGIVMTYSIYRKVNDEIESVPIAILPFGTNSYIDDVSAMLETKGEFKYYIKAQEGFGNMYNFADSSFSNEVVTFQNPHFFVPNAFVPGGVNNVFKPEMAFVDVTNYEFNIFNRWGEQLFYTTDKEKGWNGSYKGNDVEMGVYVYLFRFQNSKGKYIQKSGSVTLFR